jgi:threonine dehydrogenase-like Zn-dependent dehydrogenase
VSAPASNSGKLPFVVFLLTLGTFLMNTTEFMIAGRAARPKRCASPLADGTMAKLPVSQESALMPSLLTLSDVLGTGYHAAVKGGVNQRTSVTVIGDGAVGLLAVLSAKRLGAEQIILMGRYQARTDLGREFGATDVVAERGAEGAAKVHDLTGGHGTHVVLEAVGHMSAYEQAYSVVRPGGTISRVGVPQYEDSLGPAAEGRGSVPSPR